MRKVFFILLICLLVGVFLFASYMAFKEIHEYKKADKVYEELQKTFVEIKVPEEIKPDKTVEENKPIDVVPISVDFNSLLELNDDIVGWIYCADTPINYPVVQAEDNDTYLRRDLNGKYLVSGTIFVDYRNSEIGQDKNYILYGHNMKNGSMFRFLTKYKEQSYYDSYPIFYYLTPNGDYMIELYAGIVVKDDEVLYEPNPDETEFLEFLNNAKEKSTFKSNIEITENDMLITLSTCTYEYDDARYVIIGILKPIK